MNQLYSQLNQQASLGGLSQIKQMMNFCRGASNPQTALQTLMAQNPQMKQVMDLVQQGGGDPKTVFYRLAKQKGVDPDAVLNALK